MKLYHVFSDFLGSGETFRRHSFARSTWSRVYREGPWIPVAVKDGGLSRSSKNIGDTKVVPFIRDLISRACEKAGNEDLIVLTNADTCMALGITNALLGEGSPIAAHRYDFHHKMYEYYTPNEVLLGNWYCGADLFCFSKQWWLNHGKEYPDMLLGYEAWDWIMRELVHKHGGVIWYAGMIYHEAHPAYWYRPDVKRTHPSQRHNIGLAQTWLKANKIPLRELA